ncbi:MAG: suppressor of fused domain protein [Phycisphaeraceae bacterium]
MSAPDDDGYLEWPSPFGSAMVVVEDDQRVVYMYLRFGDPSEDKHEMKSCWVRNRVAAPAQLDVEGLKRGEAPLLPSAFCAHPKGAAALRGLSVVWFEEGDGAALFENDKLIAAIPRWSGTKGFYGYARDCTGESPFAWSLDDDNVIHDRVRKAKEYWDWWDCKEAWSSYSDVYVPAIEQGIGQQHDRYFAIDGGAWPPKALLQVNTDRFTALVTMGVGALSLPGVEMAVDDPSPFRRIELAAAIPRGASDEAVKAFGGYMSSLAGYPWRIYDWLGHGHTVNCGVAVNLIDGEPPVAVLLREGPPDMPAVVLPPFRGDPVRVLWLTPISDAEHLHAQQNGSAELFEKLGSDKVGALQLNRCAVV